MNFTPTPIPGAVVIDPERHTDERGFFARTWCAEEFEEAGLAPRMVQCSISFNARRGTLRGMHYQRAPHEEDKVVRCTRGSVFDVVLDLRPDSPTWLHWHGELLTPENRRALYVPKGCAHGFLTLDHHTEVFYQMSEAFVPGSGAGVRWDDPRFGIAWPAAVEVISERDRTYPDYTGEDGE